MLGPAARRKDVGVTFVRYKPLPTDRVSGHGHDEGGAPRGVADDE
jgi:hypothetical protein